MDLLRQRCHILVMQHVVTVSHDENDGVWFVRSSNVPRLNAEAPSFDALVEVITDIAPDLVAANLPSAPGDEGTSLRLCVQHVVTTRRAHAA
jgi:hypothetical protein